jgi:hypothetical protein
MRALAADWTRLALSFKDLSDQPGAAVPPGVKALAGRIAGEERGVLEEAAARVS